MAKAFKIKKLSKKKKKEIKGKLWQSLKDVFKNLNVFIFATLIIIEIIMTVFGKEKK